MKKFIIIVSAVLLVPVGINIFSKFAEKEHSFVEFSATKKDILLSTLSGELDSINSVLPKRADENTTLLSVSIENQKIISKYRLENGAEKRIDSNNIKLIIMPRIVENVCANQSQRALMDADIAIIMKYWDVNDKLIFDVEINAANCTNKPVYRGN